MNMEKEYDYIVDYACTQYFVSESQRNRLRVLWTAFIIKYGKEIDEQEYEDLLFHIHECILPRNIELSYEFTNYDRFYTYMSEWV